MFGSEMTLPPGTFLKIHPFWFTEASLIQDCMFQGEIDPVNELLSSLREKAALPRFYSRPELKFVQRTFNGKKRFCF